MHIRKAIFYFPFFPPFFQGRESDARDLIKGGQAVMGRPLVLKGLEIRPPNVALDTIGGTAGGSQSAAQQRILEEEGGVAAISLLLALSGCNILGVGDMRGVECKEKKSPGTAFHSNDEWHISSGIDDLLHISGPLCNIFRTDAANMNEEMEEEEHFKDLRDWMEEVALSDEELSSSGSSDDIEDVTEHDLLNWNNSEIEENEERLKERKSASFRDVFQTESQTDALSRWEAPFLGLEFGSERPTPFRRKDLAVQSGKISNNVNDVNLPCQFLGTWVASHPQEASVMRVLPESDFVFAALEMLRGVGGQIFCFKATTSDAATNVCLTPEAQGWAVSHLTPTCLGDMLEKLAKVGVKFQLVRLFCEEVFNRANESLCNISAYEVKYGRVICAFSAGLETLLGQLDDWLGLLSANLYKQRRGIVQSSTTPTTDHNSRAVVELKNDPRTLTLLRLLNVLTPWNTAISIVLDVVRRGVGWGTTGPESLQQQPTIRRATAHLLNVLYEESEFNDMPPPPAPYEDGSATECPVEEERWKAASPPEGWLLWLFCTSAAPYMRLLDEWVLSGIADDPHGELFFETVSANNAAAAAANPNSQGEKIVSSQDELDELPKSSKGNKIIVVQYTNVTIHKDCIPSFLALLANNIVLAGYATSLLSQIRIICGRNGESGEYQSSQMVQMEPFLENGLMEMSQRVLMRRIHTDKRDLWGSAGANVNGTTSGNQQQQQSSGLSNIAFQFQPQVDTVLRDAESQKNDETTTLPFPPLRTTATLNDHTANPLFLHPFTSITGVITMPHCPYRNNNAAASKAEAGNEQHKIAPSSPLTDFQLGGSKPLRKALEICLLGKLSIANTHVGKSCCNAMLKDLGMLGVLRCLRGIFLLGEPQFMETYIRGLFSAFGRLTFANGWEQGDEAVGVERFGVCGHSDPLLFLKNSTHMTWLLRRSISVADEQHQEGMLTSTMGSQYKLILEKPLIGGLIPFSKLFSIETAFPGCLSSSLVTIQSISLVGLTCHLPWPYKIVASPSKMNMYNKVHCLLIQISYVKHCVTRLQGKWQKEWRSGVAVNRTAALQLFAMAHFVRSVHSHLLTQAVASKWNNDLEAQLLEASSLADIIAAHDLYLNNLTYRCLLHRQHKPALNYLLEILQSCMSFVEFNFVVDGTQPVLDHLKGSQQAYGSFIRNCCFFVALLEQVVISVLLFQMK